MIRKILDLHIHSKYSRACSRDLELPNIAKACAVRGIDIVATGDFTHPAWMGHIKESLVEDAAGIYRLRNHPSPASAGSAPPSQGGDGVSRTQFILGTEVACIKKHKDMTRRVHLLLFAPTIEAAERLNKKLTDDGFNLNADGRPILGMTCKELLEIMIEIDDRMVMIPAHVWTPWFGIFGSKGGYDSLEDAFEELTPRVRAIETGLSSDPPMNWRWSALDGITLISNSDAHSCPKLGREANVFAFESDDHITYGEIMRIIREGDRKHFLQTIEFYPEEGKYHYDGHADCKFSCAPSETKKYAGLCPTCKKLLTIGVLHRVADVADRTEEDARRMDRVPFVSMVPLPEIVADALGVGAGSKRVREMYETLIKRIGPEFFILLDASISDIESASSPLIADAVFRVRRGAISVTPGYDGIFGKVTVFAKGEPRRGRVRQLGFQL